MAASVTVAERTGRVIVALSSAAGRLALFDTRTGQRRGTVATGAYPVDVIGDQRRERAYVLSEGAIPFTAPGNVSTIDLRHRRLLRTVAVGISPISMVLHKRSGHVVILNQTTSTRGGTVSILAASTGLLLRTLPVGFEPTALTIDEPTGHAFVTSQTAFVPRTDVLSTLIDRVRGSIGGTGNDNRGVVTMLDAG